MSDGFQQILDHIRSQAESEAQKGKLFERLIRKYLTVDPVYGQRFSKVRRWSEWAEGRAGFTRADTGIDLVAEERDGGFCAIQCKCHAPGTVISKPALDSFISASAREPFTARLVVDTGDEWGPHASKTLDGLVPACAVLRFGDLAERPINWPDLARGIPEDLELRTETFRLRPHQQAAFENVTRGFDGNDRGKLIMACGTGKTFTALRIAEQLAGVGGRVLYLVPSISLLQQSMREWATQKSVAHRYIGICSDTRAGRRDEDASLQELEIPVTTDAERITRELRKRRKDAMTVVFCTYQSLALVEGAQEGGAPAFDLVLCDEAHRTTGIEHPGDRTSPFVLVHDAGRIRARKRLYMTATARLYTESARAKASRHDVEVFSMDDPETYGPELHRLPFSRAIEQDLLSDYRVVVLTMSEQHVDGALQAHLADDGGEINITDAAKIVGCWRALQDPEDGERTGEPVRPLSRAIAFTNTIANSKRLDTHFGRVVEHAIGQMPAEKRPAAFRCETRHVDGQNNALDRRARIEWLKGIATSADNPAAGAGPVCRILSNARCLSEGIDVPALDAVLFMSPKNSHVDIVQAVGRAMRKSEGKTYGYIILPIAVPAGTDPAAVLDDNERFAAVWSVLRALRSHDDTFDAEINQIDLNEKPTGRIIFRSGDADGDGRSEIAQLPFPPLDLPAGALYAKIVERCGDRKYWENWAKDVADIFRRLVLRITGLLDNPANGALREWFDAFHEELRTSINDSITRDNAIEMMAQHLITRPVFVALFEHYDFAGSNPVAQALDALRNDFGEFGLENEVRDLEKFYESVRRRARGLDNSDARQRVLMELYEKFFSTALKKDADRLGIVYTPVEIVDFILNSTDHVLREEFGRSLSDEGVHVLDPFTGTGIFLVRLLRSALIGNGDLGRKYREELHANEIVLLAYYIAAIHIEEAFHSRDDPDSGYEPFSGIVLTDTFNLNTDKTGFPKAWLPANSTRAEKQQKAPVRIIVGNPPWSGKQKSAADENPNVSYPAVARRIAATYAARSHSVSKRSLYNTCTMAIRWASDRIGDHGIVALVTDGSWIDAGPESGLRACLVKDFSSIYVLNLRGNARLSGELWRKEGEKVFGQGSRSTVAILILVRNPDANYDDCRIFYHDIGNYLKRDEKLAILREARSISGIRCWNHITPDRHHDWIRQRDRGFDKLYSLGSQAAKSGKIDDVLFRMYSMGYNTGRDAYIYNFSASSCRDNASAAVKEYLGALQMRESGPTQDLEKIAKAHSSHFKWDRETKNNLRRGKKIAFDEARVRLVSYRPFVSLNGYIEHALVAMKYQIDRLFPTGDEENLAICVSGSGATKPFSVLMVSTMPDLNFIALHRCFARFCYQRLGKAAGKQHDLIGNSSELVRVDNITDAALIYFRQQYGNVEISKDDIFYYVYGVLHASDWREAYADDLAKSMPRLPLAPNFAAFCDAGRALAACHLGYETCKQYPLEVVCKKNIETGIQHYRIGSRPMRLVDDGTTLVVNDHIRLTGIPSEAHEYEVNGRTPLGWLIDRYRIRQDRHSGIVNDPNNWFADPRDLIASVQRIVQVSVETVRIVRSLPESLTD